MKVRRVSFAFVSAAFFAAFATTCGAAYANSPEANTVLARKAYATLRAGDAKGAIGEYSDAIESGMLEPEMLANALLNRALAYQQLQDQTLALADYDSAIKLNVMAPALRATALYNRGLALQKLGHATRAIEDFTASLLINPQFSQAFYCRANALRDSGQLLFALSDYERALKFNHPDKAKVHYGFATTYLALKRPLDAKREFGEALSLNPDYGQARAQLVMLGDENAKLETTAADPILTGSVGAYGGGTTASKPQMNAPVEVPAVLEAAFMKRKKSPAAVLNKLDDRLPIADAPTVAEVQPIVSKGEQVVAIEQVPAIPAAVVPKAKIRAVKVAALVQESESIADEQPATTGWAVQISSADTEDAAWSTWKKLQAKHKVLQAQKPNVIKADLGKKGIFYRVRLGGYEGQTEAKQACAKLKAGGVSCYISKVGS
jgi:tetratricopeptide (TPR) repeat protein